MGRPFTLLWDNFADRASLSGGNWSLPLTRLQQDDIGEIARSRSQSEADTRIDVNLGSPRPVGGFALGPTSLSPGGVVEISAYASSFGDEPMTTATFNLPGSRVPSLTLPWRSPGFWLGRPDDVETQERVYAFGTFPEPVMASRWRFQIRDEQNPAGYVDVGRLLLGRAFTPARNYDYGSNAFTIQPLTDAQESLGGSEFFWRRAHRRIQRVAFGTMSETELFGQVRRIMSEVGIDGQVFVIPEPDDPFHAQRRSFLARFAAIASIEQAFFEHGTTGFDLKEVL